MVYLITYDINTAIKDYSAMYDAIKGVSGDYGTIGKGAILKVTITNSDDTTTVYEWKITVTLGTNGPSNPGFGPGLGGLDEPDIED